MGIFDNTREAADASEAHNLASPGSTPGPAIPFDWQRDYRGNLDWLQSSTIFLCVHGSRAYGLATETSDVDIKGIAVPPKEYFLGFLKRFEQAESKSPDMTIYDVRKFFQLAADCNPNIIELLWGADEDIIYISEWGGYIRHFRDNFLSKKAKYTFSGYAIAQLKRIKTHRKWLLSPPDHKPSRGEFGLPETSLIDAGVMGAMVAINAKKSDEETLEYVRQEWGSDVMLVYQRERSYANTSRNWQQYENWKVNRNPARAEIEAKFGYDCKHAMHLVRLMRMCREILTTGQVIVKRPDREELLAIRNGTWTYDALIEWAEKQDGEMNGLVEESSLPKSPDRAYLDILCRTIVEGMLDGQK